MKELKKRELIVNILMIYNKNGTKKKHLRNGEKRVCRIHIIVITVCRKGTGMKIAQIEQILEVARVGSISQAAVNLYMTQPSLSQTIKRIEDEVGAPIFKRTNKGISLTPFGRRVVSHASDVMTEMALLDDVCRLHSESRPMELSVASGGYLFVTKQLMFLFNKYKVSPITIRYQEVNNIVELLHKDLTEIAFTGMWLYERKKRMKLYLAEGLEYHRLADATAGVYVSKSNPAFADMDVLESLEPLRKMPYVTLARNDEQISSSFGRAFPNVKLSEYDCFKRMISVSNSASMREVVAMSDGFALGLFCSAAYDKTDFYDELRFIPFKPGALDCEVGWLQKANTVRSSLAEELILLLRENLL